jgi:hypothetical protein
MPCEKNTGSPSAAPISIPRPRLILVSEEKFFLHQLFFRCNSCQPLAAISITILYNCNYKIINRDGMDFGYYLKQKDLSIKKTKTGGKENGTDQKVFQ